eukprot:7307448-Heterocapsa_arctica.AAC.1
MKTDGNENDTRGHRSRVKEVEHIENSRADDNRFDQSNRSRRAILMNQLEHSTIANKDRHIGYNYRSHFGSN